MYTRPSDLPDDVVVDALWEGWGLSVESFEFLPVGFGSHHWRADANEACWFVTVDDLVAKRRRRDETRDEPLHRLRAALQTARNLQDDGFSFAVAPIERPLVLVRGTRPRDQRSLRRRRLSIHRRLRRRVGIT